MSKKVFIWSIVAGLIASILLSYVLEPLSIWFWEVLTESASTWASDLQSYAIKNAAIGTRPWVSAIGFMIVVNIGSGVIVSLLIIMVTKYYFTLKSSSYNTSASSNKT
ncbi:TPA: hypothetical protein ACGF3Z_003493, partial [Vibrio cholerae]